MSQNFTSAGTSINRDKLPAVFRKADFTSRAVFDYGCGKYTDHIRKYLNRNHHDYIPFDPFNQPDSVNAGSWFILKSAMARRFPVDVVCSNVLNVIDSDDTVRSIARLIEQAVQATGGTAFITVYEGDRSGTGRQTGADQYQRNEPLRGYLRFFRDAAIHNGMIIIKGEGK